MSIEVKTIDILRSFLSDYNDMSPAALWDNYFHVGEDIKQKNNSPSALLLVLLALL